MTANTAGILKYRVVGVQNSVPYCHSPPLRSSKYLPYFQPIPLSSSKYLPYFQSIPLSSSKYLPYWQSPPLGSPKYGPVTSPPPPPQSQKRMRHPNPTPTSVPLSGTSDRAYAIRPYPDGQKMRTGGVGAYCIRPTNGHGRARVVPINAPSTQPKNRIRPLVRDV